MIEIRSKTIFTFKSMVSSAKKRRPTFYENFFSYVYSYDLIVIVFLCKKHHKKLKPLT